MAGSEDGWLLPIVYLIGVPLFVCIVGPWWLAFIFVRWTWRRAVR
jgi:hypothetical protein